MKRFHWIALALWLLPQIAFSEEAPSPADRKTVVVVGSVDSFDRNDVTLDVRGTLVKFPRGLFRKDLDFRPGLKVALALPLGTVKKGVLR